MAAVREVAAAAGILSTTNALLRRWDDCPRPPIRARSPFTYFVAEFYRKFQVHLKTKEPDQILRNVAQLWRSWDRDSRKQYFEMGKADKTRYDKDVADWKALFEPGHVPHIRRKRKNPMAPKRALNCYVYYLKSALPLFRQKYSSDTHLDIIRMIGESWRNMSVEEKARYKRNSAEDKMRYKRELKEYRVERKKRIAENAITRKNRRLEELTRKRRIEKYGYDSDTAPAQVVVEKAEDQLKPKLK